MKRLLVGLMLAVSLFVTYTIYTPNYQYMQETTVLLEIYNEEGDLQGHGSGVILPNGYIMTAGHVAQAISVYPDKFSIVARFRYGESSPTTLVEMEYDLEKRKIARDIALLKADTHDYPAATFSCSTQPVGTSLYIVGNPHNGRWVTTQGHVNSILPRVGYEGGWLHIDGTVNPGNSGGPVFNRWGNVVGIISHGSLTFYGMSGLNFAVSGPEFCGFLDDLNIYNQEPVFGVEF